MRRLRKIHDNSIVKEMLGSTSFDPPALKCLSNNIKELIKNHSRVLICDKGRLCFDGLLECCDDLQIPQNDWMLAACIFSCFFEPGYLLRADQFSLVELLRFAARMAISQEEAKKTIFSIGFGASDAKFLSARKPVYLIPALKIMSEFAKNGLEVPKLRIFHAHHVGILVNNLDREQVLANTGKSALILQMFIKEFYPYLFDSCIFGFDPDPTLYIDKAITFCEELKTFETTEDVEMVISELTNLHRRAKKIDAMKYSFAHPIVFGDFYCLEDGVPDGLTGIDNIETVISFGGQPERLFNWMRRYFANHERLRDYHKRRTIMLNIPIGSCPVYYPLPSEPVFGNLKPNWMKAGFSEKVARDYEALPDHYEDWAIEIQKSIGGD